MPAPGYAMTLQLYPRRGWWSCSRSLFGDGDRRGITSATDEPNGAVTAELLARPWVLSQRRLLTERQFADESKRRGLFVSDAGLEALPQYGVLVPWLRVDRDLVR